MYIIRINRKCMCQKEGLIFIYSSRNTSIKSVSPTVLESINLSLVIYTCTYKDMA